MSSFQDLYDHAAADRGRAMQFLAIQEIRRKAVNEMTSAGVYQEPDDDNMTDDDRANRRAEAAYVYGLHSIMEVSKMPDQEGDEAYAMAVRDTSTKAYCITLCLQTKMEELRANGSEKKSANGTPRFTIVVSNDGPEETTDPLHEALEVLKVAYPAWVIKYEVRSEEAKLRSAMAENLRKLMEKVQKNQTEETVQELATALMATPLVFPAQRPKDAPAPKPGEDVHLQFGKARSQDGKSYFLAFTDHARLAKWRQFSSVELAFKDYSQLILNSQDQGLIVDPYVGANMCLTKEMLQATQQQYEMMNSMMEMFSQMQNGTIEADEEEKCYKPKKPEVNEWWKKK